MTKFMQIAGKERRKGTLHDPKERGGSARLAAVGDGGAEG